MSGIAGAADVFGRGIANAGVLLGYGVGNLIAGVFGGIAQIFGIYDPLSNPQQYVYLEKLFQYVLRY